MSSAPASQPATPNPEKESELIYGLESHPPFGSSLLAALQHILAMVLSVMAPPAIVAGALGVPPEAIAYLVSMSLLFAGTQPVLASHCYLCSSRWFQYH